MRTLTPEERERIAAITERFDGGYSWSKHMLWPDMAWLLALVLVLLDERHDLPPPPPA